MELPERQQDPREEAASRQGLEPPSLTPSHGIRVMQSRQSTLWSVHLVSNIGASTTEILRSDQSQGNRRCRNKRTNSQADKEKNIWIHNKRVGAGAVSQGRRRGVGRVRKSVRGSGVSNIESGVSKISRSRIVHNHSRKDKEIVVENSFSCLILWTQSEPVRIC